SIRYTHSLHDALPILKISETQLSVIVAIPVILGSILRVPFGYLTNLIGAKWVFFWSFVILLFPIYLLGQAQSSSVLMISGFFLGDRKSTRLNSSHVSI